MRAWSRVSRAALPLVRRRWAVVGGPETRVSLLHRLSAAIFARQVVGTMADHERSQSEDAGHIKDAGRNDVPKGVGPGSRCLPVGERLRRPG